jgi:hypothetical protein
MCSTPHNDLPSYITKNSSQHSNTAKDFLMSMVAVV